MALSGQTTVTTAGTEVPLNADQPCNAVIIKALPANTGVMYIGNNSSNAITSTTGYPLSANEYVVIETKNLNSWYVDATVNGEGVAWIVMA